MVAQRIHEPDAGSVAALRAPARVEPEQHLKHGGCLRHHEDRRQQDREQRLRHDAQQCARGPEQFTRVPGAFDLQPDAKDFGISTTTRVAKNSRSVAPGSVTGHTGNSVLSS